jgi:hypothetical protein
LRDKSGLSDHTISLPRLDQVFKEIAKSIWMNKEKPLTFQHFAIKDNNVIETTKKGNGNLLFYIHQGLLISCSQREETISMLVVFLSPEMCAKMVHHVKLLSHVSVHVSPSALYGILQV